MASIITNILDKLKKIDETYKDPRTESVFIGSPQFIFSILSIYTIYVLYLGPKIMANRSPRNIKGILLLYNFAQVALNGILAVWSLYRLIILRPYDSLLCMTVQKDNTEAASVELRIVYSYLLLKMLDLMDTVFFVLRKSTKQITFLHVYHHIMVALGSFLYARYSPGGHVLMISILNSIVHVVMYFYYLMSALRLKYFNVAGLKKYITQLQLLQFVIFVISFGITLFIECDYQLWAKIWGCFQSVFVLLLFLNFYLKSYLQKSKQKSTYKTQ
ncbi:elongation of very long chain fatty acids protein AAEL008004-like [Teleopsis dalmanni]|uniref:elongation of very long chain fatty acids protein AAEL008004-like n=1 Tax=Teleopsis dalmanni TaxID=139649 RepID=UPI0018CF23B5|nr:elongation of very long chain fatty acids protein AAEL008004-like [Teleopsis dalmanni]